MYACAHLCIRPCVYVYIHACVHARVYLHVYTYMHKDTNHYVPHSSPRKGLLLLLILGVSGPQPRNDTRKSGIELTCKVVV